MSVPYGNLLEIALEPANQQSEKRLVSALEALKVADSGLSFTKEAGISQITLGGSSEEHLDGVIEYLISRAPKDFNVGVPQIAYREKFSSLETLDYTFKDRETSTSTAVSLRFGPAAPGVEFNLESKTPENKLPASFVTGLQEGINHQRRKGLLVGYPVVELNVEILGVEWNEQHPGQGTLHQAGAAILRKLKNRGSIILIEPIMHLELCAPEKSEMHILNDLHLRRGKVLDISSTTGLTKINAEAPLSMMFGYQNTVQKLAQEGVSYAMKFSRYDPVPKGNDGGYPSSPIAAVRA